MNLSNSQLRAIRDRLHNLDLNKDSDNKHFLALAQFYITDAEQLFRCAYDDHTGKRLVPGQKPKGNITIGIGFNMSAEGAKREWDKVFKGTVDFDKALDGRLFLTTQQAQDLFRYSLKERVQEVSEVYKKIWHKLRANEQLVLIDLYFNGPNLCRRRTKFYQHMHAYVATDDPKHLEAAIVEVKDRSNPKDNPVRAGTQVRREAQATLLESTACPLYTKPSEPCGSHPRPLVVKRGETILPRCVDTWPKGNNTDYYIWRTQGDDRVRSAHALLDGRVFHKDDKPAQDAQGAPQGIGEAYGCRCTPEPLPACVTVMSRTKAVYREAHADLTQEFLYDRLYAVAQNNAMIENDYLPFVRHLYGV